MKKYHYTTVQRLIDMIISKTQKNNELSLIIGLQGAFGVKEWYLKEETKSLIAKVQ